MQVAPTFCHAPFRVAARIIGEIVAHTGSRQLVMPRGRIWKQDVRIIWQVVRSTALPQSLLLSQASANAHRRVS
jgi:hypothetical protein